MLDRSSKNVKRVIGIVAMFACLVIVSLAWISRINHDQLANAAAQVSHTERVIRSLEQLRAQLAIAETAEGDYLLTGNEEFLPRYRAALAGVENTIKALQAWTTDKPAQRENLREVEVRVEERLAKLSNTVPAGEGSGKPSVLALLTSLRNKQASEATASALRKMVREEEKRLAGNEQNLEKQFAANEKTLEWMIGTIAIFAGTVLYLVLRVRRSRALARVFVCPKTIHYEGQWLSFEGYLSRRFGIEAARGISPAMVEKLTKLAATIPAPRSFPTTVNRHEPVGTTQD